MIHFVPAWYNPERPWYSTDRVWFQSALDSPADDIVTQVKSFSQGTETASLVVLNYAPSLRRFLHNQHIFDVPYWSFFDQVQGLDNDYAQPLDFLALDWPEDISFFFNPFIVTAMRGTEVYARVYLAREGTLQSIRYFGDGMPTIERVFDDRGFVSSVLIHGEDGQPMTQYYLSQGGDVVVSEDVPSGRVEIVNNLNNQFLNQSYESWESLILEFLAAALSGQGDTEDTVVLALSAQHNELVASSLGNQTLVLSRSQSRPTNVSGALLNRAAAVFSDVIQPTSETPADQAERWTQLPTLSIYPLERRATFGASANESTVYIALFADSISAVELDTAIANMATQLVAEQRTKLLICTFRSQELDYLQCLKTVIAGYRRFDTDAWLSDQDALLSVDVGMSNGPEQTIQLVLIDQEAELIATMAKTRVLVDLGSSVNHRLAAEAVNAGVPQINRCAQELSTHLINGYTISDSSELATALDYFLSGLEHWNRSLVQCRVLEDLFSAPQVLNRWELIREAVTHAGPSNRA
ncbi:MAG: accessory Sec system protein Asp1 [Micrococcales bacterium]|nr:accessory Sec system protein Asp1 [Micrococcales bacterium]